MHIPAPHDVPEQSDSKARSGLITAIDLRSLPPFTLTIILILPIMEESLATPASVSANPQNTTLNNGEDPVIREPVLVTATSTPISVQPSPVPIESPPLTTPLAESAGWSFDNIRLDTDQHDDSLVLYGNITNNTGIPQELSSVTGTFYNAQNQIIFDFESMIDGQPLASTICVDPLDQDVARYEVSARQP